jgi:hypothetical protein
MTKIQIIFVDMNVNAVTIFDTFVGICPLTTAFCKAE